MLSVALPVLFAVLIWWFSTGLVLLLDNLPSATFRWSRVVSSAVALAALAGLVHTASQTSVAAAYCAFTCALLVWGWHELSFLTGWVTGPRKTASPPGLRGWPRFSQALCALLWHELAIAAAGVLIVAITWNQANPVGGWTFLVLWVMRTSAKLNLFLGVRNWSEEFLPPQLAYLESFFRRRPMNALFPFAVTAATGVAWFMVSAALNQATPAAHSIGLLLVSSLLALAILEHWLLVLPFNATALWRWAMRTPAPAKPHKPPLAAAR
jgi:putative photosynthetic complex assembly protein 2